MKTKHHRRNGAIAPPRRTVNGQRMVLVDEGDYERLLQKADEWEPQLPAPLPNGNYPAVEYARVSLALKIIRDRRKLGLSQAELARRAGIRRQTLNRVEQGRSRSSVPIIDKIDRALKAAEKGGG